MTATRLKLKAECSWNKTQVKGKRVNKEGKPIVQVVFRDM
jgi:hypothetical protein